MPKPLQHLYLFIPNFITAFKHSICLNIFHKSFAPLGKTRAELCTRSRTRTTASCESQKYVRLLSQNNENARQDFVLPKVQPLRHLRFSIQEFKANPSVLMAISFLCGYVTSCSYYQSTFIVNYSWSLLGLGHRFKQ